MRFRRRTYKTARASTRTQSGFVCPIAKMRPVSGILLLLLTCQLATPTPIFDRDGTNFRGRSAGFGETIRDWFKVLKDRIVGKWQEWFGRDSPTPSLSPQDILNLDKTLESRIPGYPGLLLDLSSLSFDPKRDWGVQIGNWYIIRKVTGNDYKDSDSDEWDMRPFLKGLPSPPIPDWIPDFRKLGFPEATQSPTTTPKTKLTTSRQRTTQDVTQTQSVLTSTESTVTTTEAIVTSTESTVIPTEAIVTFTESIPLTTQLITTSTEPIQPIEPIESEEILTSSEFVGTNSAPVAVPTESTLTTTESITELTVPSIESTVLSIESISTTEPSSTSVKSVETSIESTVITTEAVVTSTEKLTTITTTESPITSTEPILPSIFNKRVEENETVNNIPRTTKKPRPASAEVIMF